MAGKGVDFKQYVDARTWNDALDEVVRELKERLMDQDQQRDHAEEAANRALLHEEEEVTPDDPYANYRAELTTLDHETQGICICDDYAELEFYVDPPAWPTLRKKIDAAYEEYMSKQDLEEAFDELQDSLDEERQHQTTTWGPWGTDGRPPSPDQL